MSKLIIKKNLIIGILVSMVGISGCEKRNDNEKIENEKLISVSNDIYSETKQETVQEVNGIEEKSISEKKDSYAFIPEGWSIINNSIGESSLVKGDLNKDGIDDIAVVVQDDNLKEYEEDRDLLIAFGNSDNTYDLSIRADKAVLLSMQGGTFGDPFESLDINRGSILINLFGGSSEKWFYRFRFRYQDKGWFLIGATEGELINVNDNMEVVEEDYNLLPGDYIINDIENGQSVTKEGRLETQELMNLKTFSLDSYLQNFRQYKEQKD